MGNVYKIILMAVAVALSYCCRAETEGSFNLATFNIRIPVDKTPHSWKERKERCLAVIRANRFDIFGVQEATYRQLNDLLTGDFAYIGGGRNDFKNKGEFCAVFYRKDRFKVLRSGTFGLSEKPDVPGYKSWNTAHPRIATYGVFEDLKTGKTFAYYNTHLDHISNEARENGIKLIVDHARKNVAGLPVVLTGDFNARPGSGTYQTAEEYLDDAAAVSKTPHTGASYTFNKYGRSNKKSIIDFIFVSKDIEVLYHKTDDTRFPEGFPSDHFPVVAGLVLK